MYGINIGMAASLMSLYLEVPRTCEMFTFEVSGGCNMSEHRRGQKLEAPNECMLCNAFDPLHGYIHAFYLGGSSPPPVGSKMKIWQLVGSGRAAT